MREGLDRTVHANRHFLTAVVDIFSPWAPLRCAAMPRAHSAIGSLFGDISRLMVAVFGGVDQGRGVGQEAQCGQAFRLGGGQ